MPKWFYHREMGKSLAIKLSEKDMRLIDGKLDDIKGKHKHDFWRNDVEKLREFLANISESYGNEGVKYCFLHILIDLAKDYILSEKTKDTPSARIMRSYAHRIGFSFAYNVLEHLIEDNLPEYYEVWREFSTEIKMKEEELSRKIAELPETIKQEANIEKFKRKGEIARKIAQRYAESPLEIQFYMNFIRELWSKERDSLPKEEWTQKILSKYRDQLTRGFSKEYAEKTCEKLEKIAKESWLYNIGS